MIAPVLSETLAAIAKSKSLFDKFFRDDLYGLYDSDENIILSRGIWSDDCVRYPRLFDFSLKFSLQKHWAGYSHSLGHANTLRALEKLVNVQRSNQRYQRGNLALTLGNIVTAGVVFRQLSTMFPNQSALAFRPYYPPLLKMLSYYFDKIYFASTLQSEEGLLTNIASLVRTHNTKVLFLSNGIGVEGRTFSSNFWKRILEIIAAENAYLVIDEGLWFDLLEYPDGVASDHVIRIVSTSKKFGIPGCKAGFMIAGTEFLADYYEYASTNYGGPLSVFFVFAEFLYVFEYVYHSRVSPTQELKTQSAEYNVPLPTLVELYEDFCQTNDENYRRFSGNREIFTKWLTHNERFFAEHFDFGGFNVFLRPRGNLKAYEIFTELIAERQVSVLPSSCLGDDTDGLIRVSLLEQAHKLQLGLLRLGEALGSVVDRK